MKIKQLAIILFASFFLCSSAFAEGSKFDRFATDAEVTAQKRRDVGITPASVSSIVSSGLISKLQLAHTTETLNADRVILTTDNPVLWFDCNGADRNVTLSAEASSTNLKFTIINVSDGAGEDIVLRDDTPTTLITFGPEQGHSVSCDGTSWEVWFDSGFYYDGVYRIIRVVTGCLSSPDPNGGGAYNSEFFGKGAGSNITVPSQVVAFGNNAAGQLTSGGNGVYMGANAGYWNQTGSKNTIIGSGAGYGVSGNSFNNQTLIGYSAGRAITSAAQVTAVGAETLRNLTTGWRNTAVGYFASREATTGGSNTAVGWKALYLNTTGASQVAIGAGALENSVNGTCNTAVGAESQIANTIGNYNTSIGWGSLDNNTEGNNNSGVGRRAGYRQTNGNDNVFVGYRAGDGNDADYSANKNIAVGVEALFNLENNADSNAAVGYRSGYNLTTGINNLLLGYQAGDILTIGSNNIIIGYDVDPSAAGASNELNIGDVIHGNLDSSDKEVSISGRFSVDVMTFAFTTEGDITNPLTGSVVLLDGDNDSENDTIDLQDGTTAGQILYLVAAVDIDADDTCTISMADTTCTNCPAIVFNKVGENTHLIWTGSTWIVISLQDAL